MEARSVWRRLVAFAQPRHECSMPGQWLRNRFADLRADAAKLREVKDL